MKGEAFLEIAQKLMRMRTEPAMRSGVSRAYYAAYNAYIQLLNELGFQFSKDSPAHEKVYQYLNNAAITEIKEAAETLRALRRRRNRADYDMITTAFQNHLECQFDLAHAQAIISQIEKYSKEPLCTQLRNGLREYQTKINAA